MTQAGAILITGATGTVGAPLVRRLISDGQEVIAGVRDPATSDTVAPSRLLDFEREETFDAALNGVRRVFLLRPPALSDVKRYLRPFLAATVKTGVEHVVFLSVLGVNRLMPHWQVEQDLRASSMAWTFLRPSFFAQNLQTAYGADILERSQIRLACGSGRTSFIDARDVADVAALALVASPPKAGAVHTLTGPTALNYHRVASLLSAELGRPVDYVPLSLLTYRRELRRRQLPADYVKVQLLINLVARLGLAGKVDGTVEQLLARPATPLAAYLHDRRDDWLPPR